MHDSVMSKNFVYKLLTPEDWRRACALGRTQTALDMGDGYVHLSSAAQVAETARLHYAGVEGVRLLAFAVTDLPPLKWEESRGGQQFPHLYDDLPIELACREWVLELDESGAPIMPQEIGHDAG